MTKHIFALPFIAAFSLVSACAYTPQTGERQLVAEPNSVDLMLADAADRSTRALEKLAAMESTRNPVKIAATVPNAPQELQRALTFNWNGPAEPLVEQLAQKAGYRYNSVGATPNTPIIIAVNAVNKPLINILRDIGLQMGSRADLKVDG